jgi:aminomethyltransferase
VSKKTGLYDCHSSASARFVDFGGWDMPLHYGSQIEEHHAVRNHAGVFDVSHMAVVDVTGSDSSDWLRRMLANDVAKLKSPGRGLYSCLLNEHGGVIDDLIVYWRAENSFRLVVNASRREHDIAWMRAEVRGQAVEIIERSDLAMLAVQGPNAVRLAGPLLPEESRDTAANLAPFSATETDDLFIARTGYTGEDGWEIILPPDQAISLWKAMLDVGIRPCGLGARDTLRLEAGLNLYGQDMTESISPLECGLAWTVAWEPPARDFIGRPALERLRDAGIACRFVGLLLEQRGVMRPGQRVVTSAGNGEITSGGFSPTLEQSIALARVPLAAEVSCEVEIRSKRIPSRIVKAPFVKHGKSLL